MVLTLALPVSVRAQYYSINVDYQTMAAMSEAYTTENAMEMLHNENLQKITYSSENMSQETKEVLESVNSLQETMQSFQV